jgi:NAD+ kinase
MKSKFRQVALIGKYQSAPTAAQVASARRVISEVALFLEENGCDVVLEDQTAHNTDLSNFPAMDAVGIGENCDLGLVVGGDGTMLGIGRQLARFDVPLIGINHGRLGFVTDIPFESMDKTLTPMLRGEYDEDARSLIHARVMRGDECVFDALAMNDVVVHRGATAGMVELRVEVDGRFVAKQRADGLIVATPTGSTAYSLSVGGPILHPSIAGWVLAPIAPHTLSNRPVVFANTSEIAIEIVSGRDASASFDMQSLASLMKGDRIIVKRSEHQVRFLHPRGWSYYDTLRNKLHWNEGGV